MSYPSLISLLSGIYSSQLQFFALLTYGARIHALGVVGVSDGPVKSWQNSMNQPTRCSKLLTWEANKIADRKIYKIYEIYKIYKILCNIQINVIQIAQVLNGYLVKTFDNIVSHECLKTVFVVTQLKLNFKKEPQLLQSKI